MPKLFSFGCLPRIAARRAKTHWLLLGGLLLVLHAGLAPAAADPAAVSVMSLADAEQRALSLHPQLAQRQADIKAAEARAVYAGELPDPQLRFGVNSVPVNRFALDRDSMTQVVGGISQSFPPSGKLALSQQSAREETTALRADRMDLAAQIRREVRQAWLDAFYQERALAVLQNDRELLDQITRANLSQYRVNRIPESEVLRAQLARDDLLDQEQTLLTARDTARSRLARLLQLPADGIRLPDTLPPLPALPSQAILLDQVARHPQATAMEARIRARQIDVAAAKRDYYPELGVEASYGLRFARDNGEKLPDMVSAGITLSLPLFSEKRQDARLQERQAQALALRYEHDDMLLQLREEVQSSYASYDRLQKRVQLLQDRLLPQAEQTTAATLADYRVNKGSMASVLQARRERLDYQLRLWRARVDLATTAADLDYLASTTRETPHEP